jgi:hypothetical protein
VRLTFVHPCIGRRAGDTRYIRSWQMEPLAPAVLAALTPPDLEIRFWDDRLEPIPFDETDGPGGDERRNVHREAFLPNCE